MKKEWAVITRSRAGKVEVTTGFKKTMKALYRSQKGSDLLRGVWLMKAMKQWPKRVKPAARKKAA